jgi:peptidyl-tRNA hydrolase, PTH1 family
MSAVWLMVGLGNPGPDYAGNRHNVGFRVLDLLADRSGGRFKSHKGRADIVETRWGDQRVVLAKPRTYMNESGGPVAALRDFFGGDTEHVVVVHDELDLDFEVIRLKRGGGDNGHNGLRSVTKVLGPEYVRVRVGIGRPPGRMEPASFVLRDFSTTERAHLGLVVDRAADACLSIVDEGLERAQNLFNPKP